MTDGGKGYWKHLTDSVGGMDISQVQYVMSQDSVKNVYAELMNAFNLFLFERFKEEFSAIPSFQPLVERYVNTILSSAQEYGKHAKYLEEENNKLKKELEELRNAGRC